ncbi:efflux RND transporter periplasmic adaptor subunit [Sphingomonas bacterium]|uniref:efflux RND transporter periplasmic adaptor subunit n=1 Tax=Sphingomonas bacterium TaxID=1895847 RepID=UPI00157504C8|nr:efflux RND transporter periplasmic adaptor subunit [Sphingomonas bacterium]
MKPFALIALPLMLAGCGSAETPDAAEKAKPTAMVRVASAVTGARSDSVVAYGTTEAGPSADHAIVAPAEAIVARVAAPTGTAVAAGQAIVVLRPSPGSRTALARAASDVQVADAAYARALRLRSDGLIANADVETAKAAAATAHSTQTNLGLSGNGTTLRAPVAGTVAGLTANPGDQLAAGAVIASIVGRGDLRARIGVDPAVALRIRPGMAIAIQAMNGGASVTVPVVGVDPQVDATTRLASVFVRVPPAAGLSAGQPVRATLSIGATTTGIAVPYAALLDDGGRTYVFVVRGGVASRVAVVTGNGGGDTVQILKGINPGDRVVIEGGTALDDGMKVRVQ